MTTQNGDATTVTTADSTPSRRRSLRTWASQPTNRSILLNLFILVVVAVVISSLTDRFMTPENLSNVIRQVSFVGITACAVTLVMVAGDLDLSVGSVVAIAGVVAALFAADTNLPLGLAFVIGVLVGGLAGAFNGFLVVGMRINPVIATLGTLFVFRGVALVIANGQPIKGVPLAFNDLATAKFGFLALPVLIFIIVAAVMLLIERKTLLGRWAIASGGNAQAAHLSGIPINRTRFILFVLSGLAAGITGILINSRVATGDPNSGRGFEFDVIVAIVLGGTALSGGRGTVIGTVIGVLIVGILSNGLNLLGIQSFSQNIVKGAVLIIAVGMSTVFHQIGRMRRP